MSDHPESDYEGPAVVAAADTEIEVRVVLRGYFQPIDGRFHWYGRISADTPLDQLPRGPVTLRTPEGAAEGQLSQPDVWQRFRISGTGRPPFALDAPD